MCIYRLSPIGLAANVGKKPSPAPQCLSKFSFLAFYSAPLSLSAPDFDASAAYKRLPEDTHGSHRTPQTRARKGSAPPSSPARPGTSAPADGQTCTRAGAYLCPHAGIPVVDKRTMQAPRNRLRAEAGNKRHDRFRPCKPCASQKYRYLWRAKVCIIYLSIIQLWQKKRLY